MEFEYDEFDMEGGGALGWSVVSVLVVVGVVMLVLWLTGVWEPYGPNPLDNVGPSWTLVGVATYKWPLYSWNLEARTDGDKYAYRLVDSKGRMFLVYDTRKLKQGTQVATNIRDPQFPERMLVVRVNLQGM
jgi:hypothetical protein